MDRIKAGRAKSAPGRKKAVRGLAGGAVLPRGLAAFVSAPNAAMNKPMNAGCRAPR